MRAYFAYLAHESHSFSPIPTSLASFTEDFHYLPSSGSGWNAAHEEGASDLALLRYLHERGHEVVVGPIVGAMPSAPTRRQDYERLRNELTDSLRAALPLDAVVLFLHGAQMAQGYDDCEGDVIRHVREIVGPDTPIAVELDLHCNLSTAMVDHATVLMACKEYPHTDFAERASDLIDIVEGVIEGRHHPTMAMVRVPMLGIFHTTREPMRGLVDALTDEEDGKEVLSTSIMHSYPYGDSASTSASVLVVANGGDGSAKRIAHRYADRLFSMRHEVAAPLLSVEDALAEAQSVTDGTAVIADTTDNAGGGAASDSTYILQALLDARVENAALGMIWDPPVVDAAKKAGEGSRLNLRIGGKIGPLSGDPVDLDVEVTCIRTDAFQDRFGTRAPLGDAAALRVTDLGLDLVVNCHRDQVHDPACFSELGIDPWSKRVLVVKSAQHFHAMFAPHAARILYADPPGTVTSDFASLPYTNVPRPMWPIDEAPFRAFGRDWR